MQDLFEINNDGTFTWGDVFLVGLGIAAIWMLKGK